MKARIQLIAASVLVAGCFLIDGILANAENNPAQKKAQNPTTQATTAKQDIGERKFQTNCGRCHNAPEQLSPRISGTVLRHMRVRALLSAEDEQQILKYLAP
jgi:cytochrome c5